MIKSTFRRIGRVVKPFVDFPRWMGWRNLKENGHMVGGLARDLLKSGKKVEVRKETFEEAIERLNLNEAAITARKKDLLFMTAVYLVVAVALIIYAVYLLVVLGLWLGAIMAVVVCCLSLSLAFRQHFWYIQMKYRRLGFTFNDWVNATFRKGIHS
jgi:intracellular multiplication protein IcmV